MKKVVIISLCMSLYSIHICAQKLAAPSFSGAPLSQSGGARPSVNSPASLKQQQKQQQKQQHRQQKQQRQKEKNAKEAQRAEQLLEKARQGNTGVLIALPDDYDTPTRSNSSAVLLQNNSSPTQPNQSLRSSVVSVKKVPPPVAPKPGKSPVKSNFLLPADKAPTSNRSAVLLPYEDEATNQPNQSLRSSVGSKSPEARKKPVPLPIPIKKQQQQRRPNSPAILIQDDSAPTSNQSPVESNFLLPADYDTPSRSNLPVLKVVKKVSPPVAPKPAKPLDFKEMYKNHKFRVGSDGVPIIESPVLTWSPDVDDLT